MMVTDSISSDPSATGTSTVLLPMLPLAVANNARLLRSDGGEDDGRRKMEMEGAAAGGKNAAARRARSKAVGMSRRGRM